MNEIFWCEMHRANRLNTCSEFMQCFRFHSRMKSTFHGFRSCITIEGNLMDGNPLYLVFRVATAERNTPLHHVFFLCKRKTLHHREIRENGSPVLTSQPLSPDSRHARFCVEPEVKFHVFEGLKRGEEKLIGNLFFRFSYENDMKIRSSK